MMKDGVESETNWEEIDFSVFDGVQYSKTPAEFVNKFLVACKRGSDSGLIRYEFLPLKSTLKILHGAGLVPFDLLDIEDAILDEFTKAL